MAHFDVSWEGSWLEALARLANGPQTLGIYTPTPLVTPRLLAQRGRFIFGPTAVGVEYSAVSVAEPPGWNMDKLRALLGERGPVRPEIPPVVGIRVETRFKPQLREILDRTFGLNQESLFPDLAGFAIAHGVDGVRLS